MTARQNPQPLQRRRAPGDVLAGLAAVLALLVLVVGVPLALATLIGWPLPRTVPGMETLRQPITLTTLQHVLAVFVWLAWAQFTACVIVEAKAEISGVGMPARVPGIWGTQLLARQLVAAALLLLTAAGGVTPGLSALDADAGTGHRAPTQVVTTETARDRAAPVTKAKPAPQAEAVRDAARARAAAERPMPATAAESGKVTKIYTVQPPHGRHHESLWEIADRHLGDGRRYPEIFELNKGREQPDGEKLHIARLIRPGWVLVMPADAVGCEEIRETPPAPAPRSSGSGAGTSAGTAEAADAAEAAEQAHQAAQQAAHQAAQQAAHEAREASARQPKPPLAPEQVKQDHEQDHEQHPGQEPPDSPARVPYELAGAALLAAGLLAALGRRRRQQLWHRAFGRRVHAPHGDATVAEEAIRLGADPAGARLLDLGLRSLSAVLAETGRSLPTVYAARVGEAGLDLMLARPERDAPQPWRATDDGTLWHLPAMAAGDLHESGLRGVLAPYPGLVSLGTDETGRILVDLEAAAGVIGLRGPAEQTRAVLAAVAAELATNRWSDHMRITLVGFGDELSLLAPERVASASSLAEVLPELEARASETRQALAATGVDSVLTGRCHGISGEVWMPHFLIVAGQPAPEDALRLARLASASARMPAGYLVAGEVPGQVWTWEVAPQGRLRADLLGLEVEAQQLPEPQYRAVVDLFRAAGELRGDPSDDTPPGAPTPVNMLELQRPEAVSLRLLGPVEVAAPGHLEEGRAAACTEMLVYLATHPDGVHPTVLGGAVWPRGVSAAVRDATIARVRDWLGRDPAGQPHLRLGADGRLRLSAGVRTDWEVFITLLRLAAAGSAVAGGAEPADEAAYLEAALSLVRGPLLEGRAQSRYVWLASETLEFEVPARIADAAQRLATLRLDAGDAEGAVEAVRAGLRGAPDDEELWRTLLRAVHATGDKSRLRSTVLEAQARAERDTPGGTGDDLHPQTEALIDELLPSWRLSVAT